MRILKILFVVVIFFLLSCEEEKGTVSDKGKIIHFDLEGGFYGIVADQGDHFLPENLSPDYQHDSLRIYFEGIITDRPTVQQWGRTIMLKKINIIY